VSTRGQCLCVAAFLTGLSLPATAPHLRAQDAPAAERRLAFPEGRVSGQSGSYWAGALANGGAVPAHERLLAVLPDGLVLGVVDGEWNRVTLPLELVRSLSEQTLQATLVHNHPTRVSLGEWDVRHLAKAGVARVIAIGSDGTVYEAAAARRYRRALITGNVYPVLEARVGRRLTAEAWRRREDPGTLALYVPHLVAAVLDRAQVLQYVVTPSDAGQPGFDRYRPVFERVIGAEARRLEQDLAVDDP
jgi:hypothetical protein